MTMYNTYLIRNTRMTTTIFWVKDFGVSIDNNLQRTRGNYAKDNKVYMR